VLLAALAGCSQRSETVVGPTSAGNLRLVAVQITQATQNATGLLPLIAGSPAVVNVWFESSRANAALVPVVLRLYRGGAVARADTVRRAATTAPVSTSATPTAQFLMPGTEINGALSWQVELDPAATLGDSSRVDNVLPVTAPGALTVVTLPGLSVHFVPIALSNGGSIGDISAANLDQYLTTVRKLLPIGPLTTTIEPAYTTAQSFGTPPSGGAPSFWTAVLQELDLVRLTSAQPAANWYGVLRPPSGFTFTVNGGWSYIPGSPLATGGGTRTSLSVQVGWFSDPNKARDNVAHELSHSFGRQHAPACGAGSPLDPLFPFADGSIGTTGYDVGSWASGTATSAIAIPAANGDVMGYCFPVWIGPYTWDAVRLWRQAQGTVALRASGADATVPAVLIAGSIAADGRVALRPAIDGTAMANVNDLSGDVVITLEDAAGVALATRRVRSELVDHADGERHFVAVFPAGDAAGAMQIRAQSSRGATAMLRADGVADSASATMQSDGRVVVQSLRGHAVVVRDPATSRILSIGWSGRTVLRADGPLTVSVSDGIRGRRRLLAPERMR
jgi:hypothetical protein